MDRETDTEKEILNHAIQVVKREAGLRLQIDQWRVNTNGQIVDATLKIEPTGQKLMAEIKKWAQHANLGALIAQVAQLPGQGVLVADYINPRMADKLRQKQVQFIDTAGNAYINQKPIYIYVTGNRKQERIFKPTKDGAKRAFDPKGLMVTFVFLRNPDLINATYREIADRANVAVGTVGWVINALKAGGFIRNKGAKKERHLVHCKKLLDRWVEAWPEKLKPKYFQAEYIANTTNWWENIDICKYGAHWGGEVAAAKYTGYLKPKVATLYIPDNEHTELLRDARLRKGNDEDGNKVLLYRPFWPRKFARLHDKYPKELVDPVLVYADLIATGDPRNQEVARMIYEQHIAEYCGED